MKFEQTETNIEIKYRDQTVPVIEKYTYLGVELNNKMDYKVMANHRTRVGFQTLDTITKSLRAKNLPFIFKQMLIKTILIPRMCYGIDIFGFRYDNLTKIKMIINKAIRLVANSNTVCISAMYDGMNMMPIEAYGRYMSLKNINAAKINEGSISSELFANKTYMKDKMNPRRILRTRMLENQNYIKKIKFT
jgi:hypothetical protein